MCRSYFQRPQCCQPRILKDLTDIVIISLTISLKYRQLHYNTENAYARGLTGGGF